MHPADAARQLRYATAPRSSRDDYQVAHWDSHAYEEVFADVVEQGELADVMAVIETLDEECDEAVRPSPARARAVADDVLKTTDSRTLTDGGERSDD